MLDEKSDDVLMLPAFCNRHRCLATFVLAVDISTISQQKPGHFDVRITTLEIITDKLVYLLISYMSDLEFLLITSHCQRIMITVQYGSSMGSIASEDLVQAKREVERQFPLCW